VVQDGDIMHFLFNVWLWGELLKKTPQNYSYIYPFGIY
jgi:hypothetical protein